MAGLLLGITLILWALQLLNLVAVSSLVLGLFALFAGVAWVLASIGYSYNLPNQR